MTDYRRPPDLAVFEDASTVYAAHLPDGPIVVLDGVAGLIWAEACAGPAATIVDRVAAATDAAADDIRAEVESFVADLARRELLTEHE
jgi:ferritin-like protein